MTGRPRPAFVAVAALVAAAVALALILIGGGGPYTVRAQFTDASQLVKGDLVEVGGRRVGLVEEIALTPDGLAEVTLELSDDEVEPLHEGTRATVRTIGLSGVANRFVDLRPGPPTTPAIPDGAVLPTTATRGVVDLDSVFNAVDPKVRSDIQGIVRDAAQALVPRTARAANAGLEYLSPALAQLTALGRQLTLDEAALRSVLTHTASLSGTLARRRESLGTSLRAGAAVMTAIASERAALAAGLERAPEALASATSTLRRVRTRTLPAVDPVLTAARPAIGPLGSVLRRVEPTLENSKPLIARLRALVPESRAALAPLPALERAAGPAIASATRAVVDLLPVLEGLRPYTPELVAGFFNGFGGSTAGFYDANGHYARIHLENGPGSGTGLIPRPPEDQMGGYRTGLVARCPGAAEEPAPDGSNPWVEGAAGSCDPEDGQR